MGDHVAAAMVTPAVATSMAILEEAEHVGDGQAVEDFLRLEGVHILDGGKEGGEAEEQTEEAVQASVVDVQYLHHSCRILLCLKG